MATAHRFRNRYGYPDGDILDVIAAHHGVSRDHVLLGAGSSEILEVAGRTFLPGGRKVVGVQPTFADVCTPNNPTGIARGHGRDGAHAIADTGAAQEDGGRPREARLSRAALGDELLHGRSRSSGRSGDRGLPLARHPRRPPFPADDAALRVSVGLPEEMDRFVEAFGEVV